MQWHLLEGTEHCAHRNPYGRVRYYNILANGRVNRRAAWAFESPKRPRTALDGYTTFLKGVKVSEMPTDVLDIADALEPIDVQSGSGGYNYDGGLDSGSEWFV